MLTITKYYHSGTSQNLRNKCGFLKFMLPRPRGKNKLCSQIVKMESQSQFQNKLPKLTKVGRLKALINCLKSMELKQKKKSDLCNFFLSKMQWNLYVLLLGSFRFFKKEFQTPLFSIRKNPRELWSILVTCIKPISGSSRKFCNTQLVKEASEQMYPPNPSEWRKRQDPVSEITIILGNARVALVLSQKHTKELIFKIATVFPNKKGQIVVYNQNGMLQLYLFF